MEYIATANRTFGTRRASAISADEWREIAVQLRASLDGSVAHFCSDSHVSYLNAEQADSLISELDRLGYRAVIEALQPLLEELAEGVGVWLALPPVRRS
jgi:hypothetical protein